MAKKKQLASFAPDNPLGEYQAIQQAIQAIAARCVKQQDKCAMVEMQQVISRLNSAEVILDRLLNAPPVSATPIEELDTNVLS